MPPKKTSKTSQKATRKTSTTKTSSRTSAQSVQVASRRTSSESVGRRRSSESVGRTRSSESVGTKRSSESIGRKRSSESVGRQRSSESVGRKSPTGSKASSRGSKVSVRIQPPEPAANDGENAPNSNTSSVSLNEEDEGQPGREIRRQAEVDVSSLFEGSLNEEEMGVSVNLDEIPRSTYFRPPSVQIELSKNTSKTLTPPEMDQFENDPPGIIPQRLTSLVAVDGCCAEHMSFNPSAKPNLRHLDLSAHPQLYKAQYDDISRCGYKLKNFNFPVMKQTLRSLVLRDVSFNDLDMKDIFLLKNLWSLDISAMQRSNRKRILPDTDVFTILDNFPSLRALDVSCTAIGDKLLQEARTAVTKARTGAGGDDNVPRLDFLGLFQSRGCEFKHVNKIASAVTGYCREQQMVHALQRYVELPARLATSLEQLKNNVQHVYCTSDICEIIPKIICRNPTDVDLHIHCEELLQELQEQENCVLLSAGQYKKCVTSYCWYIRRHMHDERVVERLLNCLRILPIEDSVELGSVALVHTVCEAVDRYESVNLTLCQLAFQLSCMIGTDTFTKMRHSEKLEITARIFELVGQRIKQVTFDRVLTGCWAFMYGMLENQLDSCTEFVRIGGLEQMEECFTLFPDKMEMKKLIVGCVCRIAEMRDCRPFILHDELLQSVQETVLLAKVQQRLDVQFRCCYALAFALTIKPKQWLEVTENRYDEIKRMFAGMVKTLSNFVDASTIDFNFVSSAPIVDLLESGVDSVIYFTCWMIHGLVHFCQDPRFMTLMKNEELTQAIKQHVKAVKTDEKVREWARVTLQDIGTLRADWRQPLMKRQLGMLRHQVMGSRAVQRISGMFKRKDSSDAKRRNTLDDPTHVSREHRPSMSEKILKTVTFNMFRKESASFEDEERRKNRFLVRKPTGYVARKATSNDRDDDDDDDDDDDADRSRKKSERNVDSDNSPE